MSAGGPGSAGQEGGPAPRPAWDFDYAPVIKPAEPPEPTRELVVATAEAVHVLALAAAAAEGARAEVLLARAPLFWTRLTLAAPALAQEVAARLAAAGLPVRYVTPADRPSLALGPPLAVTKADLAVADPRDWRSKAARAEVEAEPPTPGRWFLRADEGGAAVDRARCGVGKGARLAVIDDDALDVEALRLDREVLVGLEAAPRHQTHGSLMVAWATRARAFLGVAPEASARLYLIPKPGGGLWALPLAIARAIADGADVVMCATYLEGSTSPLLDDALAFATRAGRGGLGAAVVFPTGRETASAGGSVHASLSLGLGEPASDPRAFCVGPSGRGGGWFFYRDRKGRSRPFANRGPAVRWLAPGDDLAFPLGAPGITGGPERLFHAESSGATAVAAGVLLLCLAQNPTLSLGDLEAAVDRTLSREAPETPARHAPLADPWDELPVAADADGHNPKHGRGRIHARRACLTVADPVAASLVAIGAEEAASSWAVARKHDPAVRAAYSSAAAQWVARALLRDPASARVALALARHARLASPHERARAHGDGAFLRQLATFLDGLGASRPPARVRAELDALGARLRRALADPGLSRGLEDALFSHLRPLFARAASPPADT